MDRAVTIEELTAQIRAVTSQSDARAVVNRASRVAGVQHGRELDLRELLLVCSALAAEGGLIQEIADSIASRALDA